MSIFLKNSSTYVRKKGTTDWWDWTAYIECTPPDSLQDIEYVEYYLHPSFPNPVRRIYKEDGGFIMKTSGWGVFELKAKVLFKNSARKPEILAHSLKFEYPGID